MNVEIPLYPDFDSLDVLWFPFIQVALALNEGRNVVVVVWASALPICLGPFQTFTFAGMDRYLVAAGAKPVTSFEGVTIQPHKSFQDCPQLDVLFVPGGCNPVTVRQVGHPGCNPYLDFLIRQAAGAS
jgi:putative intracellular protease/amidase